MEPQFNPDETEYPENTCEDCHHYDGEHCKLKPELVWNSECPAHWNQE